MMNFTPRPSQQNILRYNGGRLGIAAVPGAGKTHILSALAAQIIAGGTLQDGQEVLIVTLVNSAVDNFEARIKRFFENPLLALYKYRVRTLHGLAHDIVREKPASVGLENQFSIIDEREANQIRTDIVRAYLQSNTNSLASYLRDDLAENEIQRAWRDERNGIFPSINNLATAFIRSAKDRLLTPEQLRALIDASPVPLPLAEIGWNIYMRYQRRLKESGQVDFDDLIRLALTLLEHDEEFLERLRFRYPFILEDEAQDSSRTQERILALLSGSSSFPSSLEDAPPTFTENGGSRRGVGNWVRVGDPNQAIFETFTTASPELLRAFIRENPSVDMPESGRSQPSVLAVANHLIDWVMRSHPLPGARTALSLPYIQPVPEGYQPVNPPDQPEAVRFMTRKYAPEEELEAVARSVKGYLDSLADVPDAAKPTIAILVPRNQRGVEVIDALRKRGIDPLELVSSTSETRAAAGSLNYLLSYLADPQSARKLAKAYEVWRRDWRSDVEKMELIKVTSDLLRRIGEVETFVAPAVPLGRGTGIRQDWLALLSESESEQVIQELADFRVNVRRWLDAVTLPIDQLILTLAQDVFSEASDLALAHKLALVLRKAAADHGDWRLPELTSELAVIAKNERRFIGFSSDDSGFDPERHRGKVVVTTMHKAKGLEWDRVYIMSVNNYDFPSDMPGDRFISEKWFIRGGLNLEAEALAQLTALESTSEYNWYEEGAATQQSRLDYVKERLRLFYVGITRAKRDLIVTWNSGRQGDATPSLALSELMGWWETVKSAR